MPGPSSGVTVDLDLVNSFTDGFKSSGAKNPDYDYLTGIIKGSAVIKGKCPAFGDSENEEGLKKDSVVPLSYQSLKKYLLEQSAGYAFYIFSWKQADGVHTSKVVQITYVGENSTSLNKMMYSTTKETVAKAIKTEQSINANDAEDLEYVEIVKEISKQKAIF